MSELFANKQGLRSVSAAFAAFVASALLGGCPFVNQNHCAYMLEQGMASPCAGDQVCSKCTPDNNGCVAPADVEDGCALALTSDSSTAGPTTEPTGSTSPTTSSTTMTTVAETDSTTMMVSTESSTSTASDTDTDTSTTSPTTETDTGTLNCHPDENILDDFCAEPGKPYCVGPDQCGPCGQLDELAKSCADVEPNKPVCHASGRCVECSIDDTSACPVDKPGCDEDTGTCSKCTEHSQCPNTACDMKVGTCFPDDSIIWVQNTIGKCNNNGGGTEATPFCTLLAASNMLMPGKPTTIKVVAGQTGAMQPLSLASEGYILAIVRGNQTIPVLDGSANNDPMIQVSPGSRVYLSNLRLSNTNGPAIVECAGAATGAELYLDDMQVNGNGLLPAKAIDGSNCLVKLRRTRIYKNRGGVQLSGGTLWSENSHFTENGTAASQFGAFNFLGNATATITYTSIALQPKTASSSVFNCTGALAINVRNSAITGVGPLTKNCNVIQTSSRVEPDVPATDWFTGPTEGVLRAKKLGNPPPLKDVAIWTMGDPRQDYDREDRPTVGPSWAGADEPL